MATETEKFVLDSSLEDQQLVFREAMSRLPAAVNIVTTDGPGGRAGFTASAVCSVTDRPPTLLVCLNRNASVSPSVHRNGVLCVNVLGEGRQAIATLFGGKIPMEDRFAAADWIETTTGAPRLADALVSFDCEISQTVDVGSHAVLFCRVIAMVTGTTRSALLYFGRSFHNLLLPD